MFLLSRFSRSRFLSAALLLAPIEGLAAPPAVPAVTLEAGTATSRFLAENAVVKALRARTRIAEAKLVAARTRPNPTFGYELEALPGRSGVQGSRQQAFKLSQPILLGGKLGARLEAARGELARSAAEIEAEIFGKTLDFRREFFRALAAHANVQTLREGLDRLRKLERILQRRTKEGVSSRYDLLRLTAEAAQLESQQQGSELELARHQALLSGLLGYPSSGPTPAVTGQLEPPPLLAADVQGPLRHPELLQLDRELDLARAELGLARKEARPDLSVFGGSLTFDQGGDQHGFTAGLAIELPITDRRQGQRAEARARIAALEQQRDATAQELETRLRAAWTAYEGEHRRVHDFREKSVEVLDQVLQTVSASYAEGQHSLLELLDGHRLHREARLAYLRQVEAARMAFVELEQASGHLIHEPATPARTR